MISHSSYLPELLQTPPFPRWNGPISSYLNLVNTFLLLLHQLPPPPLLHTWFPFNPPLHLQVILPALGPAAPRILTLLSSLNIVPRLHLLDASYKQTFLESILHDTTLIVLPPNPDQSSPASLIFSHDCRLLTLDYPKRSLIPISLESIPTPVLIIDLVSTNPPAPRPQAP